MKVVDSKTPFQPTAFAKPRSNVTQNCGSFSHVEDVDDVWPLVSKSSVAAALNCRSTVRGDAYLQSRGLGV
jgi:hypothetical protein